MNDYEAKVLQESFLTDEHLCLLPKTRLVHYVEDVDYYIHESRHAGTQTDEAYDNKRYIYKSENLSILSKVKPIDDVDIVYYMSESRNAGTHTDEANDIVENENLSILSKVKVEDDVVDVEYYMSESRLAGTHTDEANDIVEIFDADTKYFMGIVTKQELEEMIRNAALPDDDASKRSLEYDEESLTFTFSNITLKSETSLFPNETINSKRGSRTKKVSTLTVSQIPYNALASKATVNFKASSLSDKATRYKDPFQPEKENEPLESSTFTNIVKENTQDALLDETSTFKISSDFDESSNFTKPLFPNKNVDSKTSSFSNNITKSKRKSRSKKDSKSTASSFPNNFLTFKETSNFIGSPKLDKVSPLKEPKMKKENDVLPDEALPIKKSSNFDETSNSMKSAFSDKALESMGFPLCKKTSIHKSKSRSKKSFKSTASSLSNNILPFEKPSNFKRSPQLDVSTLKEPKVKKENDVLPDEALPIKKSSDFDETSNSTKSAFSDKALESMGFPLCNKTSIHKSKSRSKKSFKSTASSLSNNILPFEKPSNFKRSPQLDVSTLKEPKVKKGNDPLPDAALPIKKSSDFDETSNSTKSAFSDKALESMGFPLCNKTSIHKSKSRSKKSFKLTASSLSNNILPFEKPSNFKRSPQLDVSTLKEPKVKKENDPLSDAALPFKKSSDFDETSNSTKSAFSDKALESMGFPLCNKASNHRRKSRSKKAFKSTASSLSNNFFTIEEPSNFKKSPQLDVARLKEPKVKKGNDNETKSGKFNIRNDNIKLEKDCNVMNTSPETRSRPKLNCNKPENPPSLTTSEPLSHDTSNNASTIEKIITGMAFHNLPRFTGAKIPESAQRKRPQSKQLDMVDVVKGNKEEPPYITECGTHNSEGNEMNGDEDHLNPTDLPPHSAIEAIESIENLLEMVLTFGFNQTYQTEDQFGSQIVPAPVINSMGLIREALEPIKSYIKSAEDTEFFRPFMNTVKNSIKPAFNHLNDMKLAIESPQTKNFTQFKLEKKKPNQTNDRDDKIVVSSVETDQPNQIICQPNNQNYSQEHTEIILPDTMPYTTFTKFPWIPKGPFDINSLQSSEQEIIPPNQNVQNNISESVNQHQSSVLRLEVPRSDSARIYHNPITTYRPARVNPHGVIELQFKQDILVVLTADLSVLMINKKEKMAAAFSSDGYRAGLKFLYGECSLKGRTIKFASTNKDLETQIRANICEKGITFRGKKSPMSYIITKAGIKKSKGIYTALDEDFLGQIIYGSGKFGPEYVQECNELFHFGKNEVHSDGSIYWYFRDMKIFQNWKGTVTVFKDNFTYSVCMSPFHQVQSSFFNGIHMYAVRIKIPGIKFASSVTADDKHQLFVKQGRTKEIFSSNEKFSVRNGSHFAELNTVTHNITSPLKKDQ